MNSQRPPRVLHCTSEPLLFFGRRDELALLDRAVFDGGPSLIALVGPGGQGKTAIVQHWLHQAHPPLAGLFFWSFYRGKNVDQCLRELLAYAERLPTLPEVSGSWCVDRLLPLLRRERWAVVLDGAEVVQYEDGPWRGRFVHPDLGRLLEELASEPMPGAVILTTRFDVPTLIRRPYCRIVSLAQLDADSARALLAGLGVAGSQEQLDAAAQAAGRHAKAVELLGTLLVSFHRGDAGALDAVLAEIPETGTDEEACVARVLTAYQRALPLEQQDLLAMTTAFREPPEEALLLRYLASPAVHNLLHASWGRTYPPFALKPSGWLDSQLGNLTRLRLLERVAGGDGRTVVDAHPLVRRAFEHVAGSSGRRESALARSGFLRGRPDRRRPATLEEAREEIELFHAHCEAGLWTEADGVLVAMENPKHRFLAPTLERDLLLRFFPDGDWRRPPLWGGFGRWRSLAICFEMIGRYEDALAVYRPADQALRGDALLALGRIDALVRTTSVEAPWQTLWQAYRAHALALAGRTEAALAVARATVPVDIYEWVHVFEGLIRSGGLRSVDLRSVLARPAGEHRWADLARRRMHADYRRILDGPGVDLHAEYADLLDAYDRAGLPYERVLTRLSHTAWLLAAGRVDEAARLSADSRALVDAHDLGGLRADVLEQAADIAARRRAGGRRGASPGSRRPPCADGAGRAAPAVRIQ
ncbi:MAG: ATP-binding protein [Gemmataceae bacterium]